MMPKEKENSWTTHISTRAKNTKKKYLENFKDLHDRKLQ